MADLENKKEKKKAKEKLRSHKEFTGIGIVHVPRFPLLLQGH